LAADRRRWLMTSSSSRFLRHFFFSGFFSGRRLWTCLLVVVSGLHFRPSLFPAPCPTNLIPQMAKWAQGRGQPSLLLVADGGGGWPAGAQRFPTAAATTRRRSISQASQAHLVGGGRLATATREGERSAVDGLFLLRHSAD